MSNFINKLEVSNFKSIKHLELVDFRKINLFIGKPNVGKSNFLEALSLFNSPLKMFVSGKLLNTKLKDFIRFEHETELFYEGNIENDIKIKLNESFIQISNKTSTTFGFDLGTNSIGSAIISTFSTKISNNFQEKPFETKTYLFKTETKFKKSNRPYLDVPFGKNILEIIERLPELKNKIAYWFREYGLKVVYDRASQSLKILKENNKEQVFLLPYNSVADTLRRIIFYKTAIASNNNSVLIFEEPEAHAFPPYIAEFTQEVINSSTNQFFIATHSPIVVNDFLENAREDLAIFMVDFKNGQTVIKTLTRNEIEEVYKYGVDLFFNNEAYTN